MKYASLQCYPEDRFEFARWREFPRPSKSIDWQWNGRKLTLMLGKGEHSIWIDLSYEDLKCFPLGWRKLVAMSIKKCRREIRRKVEHRKQIPTHC